MLYGGAFMLALMVLLPFLPDNIPSAPFTVAYIFIARMVVEKYQMTKTQIIESPRHDFHSNWRVLGLGLVCVLGFVALFGAYAILLVLSGIWEPG